MKKEYRSISILPEARVRLTHFSRNHGLTISEAIDALLDFHREEGSPALRRPAPTMSREEAQERMESDLDAFSE